MCASAVGRSIRDKAGKHLTRYVPLLLPLMLTGCDAQMMRELERLILTLMLLGVLFVLVILVLGLLLVITLLVLAYFAHKKDASVAIIVVYGFFTLNLAVTSVGIGVLVQGPALYASVVSIIPLASAVRLLLARSFPDKPAVSWGAVGALAIAWAGLVVAVPLLMPRPPMFDEPPAGADLGLESCRDRPDAARGRRRLARRTARAVARRARRQRAVTSCGPPPVSRTRPRNEVM